MKKADVKIGGEYFTRVGQAKVKVRVTGTGEDYFSKRTVFRCVRVDNGKPLPKGRAPSALHLTEDFERT